MNKRIALIAPVFPPLNSSGAVQLWDLSKEFVDQGYELTVFVPSSQIEDEFYQENREGVDIVRLRTPKSRDMSYIRRTISEFLTPYCMIKNLRHSAISNVTWDGIVWYSPSIFLTPFVRLLKNRSNCRSYLILRDIFPEWALNLGLIKKGPVYWFFKIIEYSQYKVANTIGIQAYGNIKYFHKVPTKFISAIEVLQNWLAKSELGYCSINISSTVLSGRKIVVYAGNMGVAQDLDIFIELAKKNNFRSNIGFLFVGRGSKKSYLEKKSKELKLTNILFFNEIQSSEIPGLFKQCDVGIVSLDMRHLSHNVPGKFLSYMAAGLPVLALLNRGNDLIDIIEDNDVGFATSDYSVEKLDSLLSKLVNQISTKKYSEKCQSLFETLFSPKVAVHQITRALFE